MFVFCRPDSVGRDGVLLEMVLFCVYIGYPEACFLSTGFEGRLVQDVYGFGGATTSRFLIWNLQRKCGGVCW